MATSYMSGVDRDGPAEDGHGSPIEYVGTAADAIASWSEIELAAEVRDRTDTGAPGAAVYAGAENGGPPSSADPAGYGGGITANVPPRPR